MKIKRIGVDLAKNVFQLHGVDCHEQVVLQALSEETACCIDGVEVACRDEQKIAISLLQDIP